MKKSGQPDPSEQKKEATPAPGANGSLLDKVSEEAARQEGPLPEDTAPAGDAASTEPAPSTEAPADGAAPPASSPAPSPAP